MIEQLFGSKTRVKLLRLFYSNPNRSFYVREITRKIDEQINSVRRELANLLSIGIISSDTNNNRLYYEVDQKYEFYPALSVIFGTPIDAPEPKSNITSATDVRDDNANPIKLIGNVELALFTGHFTRDESSGVDILIVGDVNPTQLTKYISELEKQESRDLRYTVMSLEEFRYRKEVNDRFLSLVLDSKNQVIADKNSLMGSGPSS
jgi:predicted transcriptional regulator